VDLSARERAALHRLESQLSKEDPALAACFASAWRLRVPSLRVSVLLVVLLPMLVGVQVAVVGATAGSQLLTMAGLVYAVLAPCGALLVGGRRR
jgi:hypothetical protein